MSSTKPKTKKKPRKPRVIISAPIHPATLAILRRQADARGWSVSAVVRNILDAAVGRRVAQ